MVQKKHLVCCVVAHIDNKINYIDMYKQLKRKLLLLLVCGGIGTVSGQAVLKVGSNPYSINTKAVLDVESTTMGLLPPRMTKAQRDAIATPPAGLLVWCNDCNVSTEPVSGELCVYLGTGWSPFTTRSGSSLTTGKKSDANAPVWLSATSARIKGVLVSNVGAVPTETGIVYREIIGTDFGTLPLLDGTGVATVPTYKKTGTLVTTAGAAITEDISSLSSTRPYYFRTYAKTALGIGYGNPVIFNCAPPVISAPEVTGSSMLPTFAGTLTVNAGTPVGTITEYGYCSGTATSPTTANNKVVLSTGSSITALNATLNSETFTAHPTINLAVEDYNVKTLGTTYFRYYVIANGVTTYSPQANFNAVFVSPVITTPVVTAGTSLLPKFAGTMSVSAGTPSGLITEYGYYSGTSPSTTTNKKVLSNPAKLGTLNASLDVPGNTVDPTVDLAVADYNVIGISGATTYFRYYVVANGTTRYSSEVIFAPNVPISSPVVTNGTSLLPTFAGTFTVNAGTPKGKITEYGYCSGTTASPTTANNKVVLSTTTTLGNLDTTLGVAGSAGNFTVDLAVANFDVTALVTTYFRYYVTANGDTTYSSIVNFTPAADAVTGGTAIATIASIDPISAAPKIDVASTSTIKVNFTVTKAGTYASFVPGAATGATAGLTLGTKSAGSFALGAQSLTFQVSGTPGSSLSGNSFAVPRIGSLSTGAIQIGDENSTNYAICGVLRQTTVVPITSTTGKIWMDRNLGASRAGTSSTDYEAYGCLYQWGRGNDGHAGVLWASAVSGSGRTGTTTTLSATDSPGNNFIIISTSPYDWRSTQKNSLWQGAAGINNPCPDGYRVPTNAELTAEFTAYSITNSATAYTASPLKFMTVGVRWYNSASLGTGVGYYWSSTVSGVDASYRYFDSGTTVSSTKTRGNGMSVRCLKD